MSRYEEVVASVQSVVGVSAGISDWEITTPVRGGDCDPGQDSSINGPGGTVWRTTPSYVASPIPQDEWPAVLEGVTNAVGPLGFDDVTVLASGSAGNYVVFSGPDGSTLQFFSDKRTLVKIDSGCHPLGNS